LIVVWQFAAKLWCFWLIGRQLGSAGNGPYEGEFSLLSAPSNRRSDSYVGDRDSTWTGSRHGCPAARCSLLSASSMMSEARVSVCSSGGSAGSG